MEKRVQAKDVPEVVILQRMKWFAENYGDSIGADMYEYAWMTHFTPHDGAVGRYRAWSLTDDERLAKFPEKVLVAKLHSMRRRGLIDGCGCGCRGDWHLVPKGIEVANALDPYEP